MTDPDEGDRRIAHLELELAKAQTAATYFQIEAALVRQRLKATLSMAAGVIGRLAAEFDANVQRMADDLNGRGEP